MKNHTTKTCSRCKRELPANNVYFNKEKNRLKAWCRDCCKAYSRKRYADKREEYAEYRRQYRAKPGYKERKRFLANQPEQKAKRIGYMREYNTRNIERIREYARNWGKTHLGRKTAKNRERRARLYSNGGSHTEQDIQLLYKSQRGLCWWCGKPLEKYHVDHRIPIDKGGTDNPSNLCLACPPCNLSKGSKLPHEWIGRLL